VITGLILKYLPSIIGVLALIAALAWIYEHIENEGIAKGKAKVQALWDADTKARQQAEITAVAQREKENAATAQAQTETNELLKKEHANEIANLDAKYSASQLRINTAICGKGSAGAAKAPSPSGSNEANPTTRILPEPYNTNIKQLMREADELAASCRSLQGFVKDNGLAP
jgi:hypothetical protein